MSNRQGLSFTEQHEVKDLQKRMEKLQAEIAKQKAVLDDSGLYHRDPDGFARAAKALETAETALATAEDRWLELELKREAAAEGSA